jgi:hypothetical protein
LAVLPAEFVDSSGSIHKTLLSGEKGMTVGTDLHLDVFRPRGMRLQDKTTGALDLGLLLLRMNIALHTDLLT